MQGVTIAMSFLPLTIGISFTAFGKSPSARRMITAIILSYLSPAKMAQNLTTES
jgi:hypothetical protein